MNVLKTSMSMEDAKRWLKQYWPFHQKLGALEIDVYQSLAYNEAGVFFVKYKLKSLDKYFEGITGSEGEKMLKSLSEIVDTAKTTSEVIVEVPL
jgi:hypothetical protein